MNDSNQCMWDGYCRVTVKVDRPAKAVWPYFFGKMKETWSGQTFTLIEGVPGRVGEIYVMPFRGGLMVHKAIKVDPERLLVLKLSYQAPGTIKEQLVAYDVITLDDARGFTEVSMHQMFSLPAAAGTDVNVANKKHEELLTQIFLKMKGIVENGST